MSHPIQVWRTWLLQGLAQRSVDAAGKRRPHVGMVGVTLEWEALPRVLRRLRLAPAAAAALRGVTVGDVVVQKQAKHWCPGDDGTCPYCLGEEEDERHRWFRCPVWEGARRAAGLPSPATAFEHQLPQAMATWGLPVIAASVAAWCALRTRQRNPLPAHPAVSTPRIIRVDGSGLHPKDSLLRTVAWATAWLDDQGWHTAAGPVTGAQTVPRSEATAILSLP